MNGSDSQSGTRSTSDERQQLRSSMPTSTERLLEVVWGNRNGFVFLPHKDATDPEYPKRGWHETQGYEYRGSLPNLQDLPQHADLYFCPVVFSKNKRRKENALPTNILWADLDPVHPDSCLVRPSIAWESSPGRYQALWLLNQEVDPEEAAQLSKRIAYGDGGDKGGWDLTQVLRIPGSKNFKYKSRPPVRLLWAKRQSYNPALIRRKYPKVNGLAATSTTSQIILPTEMEIQATLSALPLGLKRQLSASTDGADRSLQLQKLARDLIRSGQKPGVVFSLLQRSTWNKFSGRSDETQQLEKQVRDALDAVKATRQPSSSTMTTSTASTVDNELLIPEMRVHDWTSFLSIPTQLRWLVQDSWVDQTVGFISGRSKSYKTWIALDLALSVLSGKSFLSQYAIGRTGPVLLIQEEDPTAILQERLRLISKSKGMLPQVKYLGQNKIQVNYPDYPLKVINMQGFNLTTPEKIAQVRRIIGEQQPVMVILDPLIVMLGQVDEHRATEIASILQEVKMWREDFGCNVVVVHHWNKTKTEDGDRGGAHMYGSFAFHAWLESALHLEPKIDPESSKVDTVILEREFKAAPGSRSQTLRFDIDTVDKYTYEVIHASSQVSSLAQKLLDILAENGGEMTTGELVTMSGYSRSKVVDELGKLRRMEKVNVTPGGGRGKTSKYSSRTES